MKNNSNGFKILDKLLEEIEENELDMQVKQICDQIQEEEDKNENEEIIKHRPSGPNIFVSLEIDSVMKDEINFLCLEREFPEEYFVSIWSKKRKTLNDENIQCKRISTIKIPEVKPKKIILFYARILKINRKGDK